MRTGRSRPRRVGEAAEQWVQHHLDRGRRKEDGADGDTSPALGVQASRARARPALRTEAPAGRVAKAHRAAAGRRADERGERLRLRVALPALASTQAAELRSPSTLYADERRAYAGPGRRAAPRTGPEQRSEGPPRPWWPRSARRGARAGPRRRARPGRPTTRTRCRFPGGSLGGAQHPDASCESARNAKARDCGERPLPPRAALLRPEIAMRPAPPGTDAASTPAAYDAESTPRPRPWRGSYAETKCGSRGARAAKKHDVERDDRAQEQDETTHLFQDGIRAGFWPQLFVAPGTIFQLTGWSGLGVCTNLGTRSLYDQGDTTAWLPRRLADTLLLEPRSVSDSRGGVPSLR